MNKVHRRQVCALIAGLPICVTQTFAQAFPFKPIRLVIPFPGGFTDTLARMVGQKMSEGLGQAVVIEQRPGGSGQIAAAEVMKSPADGHTLFMVHIGTHALNVHVLQKLNYDPERDFTPVIELVRVPNLLVISPTLPAASIADLLTFAKARPGTLFYASPGNGSSGHLAGELLKTRAGIDITHVPYKGTAEALQDLFTGRVHLMFDTLAQGAQLAKAGKVKALAVTSAQRHGAFPEFPTMAESGFPGWDTGPWFGLAVRNGTPEAAARTLHSSAAQALAAPEVRDRLLALGALPVGGSAQEFASRIRSESARWGSLARDLGIKAD